MSIRSYQGDYPRIDDTAYIDQDCVVIGKVTIGAGASVWPMAVVRGDVNTIDIGSDTNIQDGSVLHCTHASDYVPDGSALVIGERVTVGHNVTLHACTIGNDCLIGMGSVVLDGAVLKAGTMLAAGSLVPMGKILEGGYLWMGSPAKKIRRLNAREQAFLTYSAQHYRRLACDFIEESGADSLNAAE